MGSSEQQYCLRWNNYQVNLLAVFEQLLQNEAFTDVTLIPEEGPPYIRCHKMVLAACSTYFQTLFIHLPSTDHPVIVLKDVKYAELKAILDYMYRGEVNVAQDKLTALLKVAEDLKVKGLVNDTKLEIRRDETDPSLSPPPAITTSTTNSTSVQSLEGLNGQTSPPLCTSSSYSNYNKSPRNSSSPRISAPMWNINQLTLAQQHQQHLQILAKGFPAYDAFENKTRKQAGLLNAIRDTPILRTVLGQGHADSSQGIGLIQPDSHDIYRSPSIASDNDIHDGRRSSMDLSHGHNGTSPHASEHSMIEEDDRKPSLMNIQENQRDRKPEWKRYKQYSRQNIADAIEAVRGGMSALKASQKFNVPSRTLYDKVKKLGISTPRPFRRGTNNSGACFPYGIGGNANGSIYAAMNENEQETGGNLIESPASILETAFAKNRENLNDYDNSMDCSRTNHSPVHQQVQETNDNEVEDLSINRKQDVRVIVPPTCVIKDEKIDIPDNVSH